MKIKPNFIFHPISWAFIISIIYWFYLACTSSMIIVFDSVGYEDLGRRLLSEGWRFYFETGPNREPVYPFIIAIAMSIAENFSLSYQSILTIIQIFILFLTQYLSLILLKKLNISPFISALTILYIGISPGLLNSALSLYSEISTYPFILLIIIFSSKAWTALQENNIKNTLIYAVSLGTSLTLMTLARAAFEVITPLFLLPFIFLLCKTIFKKNKKSILLCLSFLLITLSIFYSAIFVYKSLNQTYNGKFVLTNRGSWALYGNTARRMEATTFRQFLIALAYMPGEGVCKKIFTQEECDFWSFKKSDEHGYSKNRELHAKGLSGEEIDAELLRLSKQKILKNPPLYILYMSLEGIKMLFWESTQIGFVQYPGGLNKLFTFAPFKNGLRLFMFFITTFSLILSITIIWKNKKELRQPSSNSSIIFFTLILLLAYIGIHSFFFTLTRYSLPIAPLFLILIAFCFNHILKFELKK